MKRATGLPELLAPAGDFECLVAAVAAGADAIYVGGKRFGARAYAKNFDTDELSRAVKYCHLHGVKLYVTVNTLVYDKEMDEVVEFAAELYRLGVDALIIADLGAIAEIRRAVPQLELHASTQMSVHNTRGADAAAELGCSRVVLARELSYRDIVSVTESCRAEVEVFLHGALCVCHSGQCLFSSLVGGRSGNRGECAQPCRLPYNNSYPLSLSDLSLAEHVSELIDSGVASLKIEGRMKSPSYVYTVTRIYRHLLDERRMPTQTELVELRAAFSRGDFTDGYFTGNIAKKMTGTRTEGDKELSRSGENLRFEIERIAVKARVTMRLGEMSKMTLYNSERTVCVTGDAPERAIQSPLTREAVTDRLSKMGNTFLSLSREDIELVLDEGVNLSPAAINALRRRAAEAFESTEREAVTVLPRQRAKRVAERGLKTALYLDERAYHGARCTDTDVVFLPLFSENLSSANGVYLPPVIMESEMQAVRERLEEVKKQGILYTLVGNIAQIELSKEFGLVPIGDFRLNVTNSSSAEAYRKMGVESLILSPELTLPQARDIGGAVITYGRIPLMITERCFIRDSADCSRCGRFSLTDRLGERFPIMREWQHRNLILNSRLTYMGDKSREISSLGLASHLIFTTESAGEISEAMKKIARGEPLAAEIRRVGRRAGKSPKNKRTKSK